MRHTAGLSEHDSQIVTLGALGERLVTDTPPGRSGCFPFSLEKRSARGVYGERWWTVPVHGGGRVWWEWDLQLGVLLIVLGSSYSDASGGSVR